MSTTEARQPLTNRQREVWAFVRDFRIANGFCPTVREVCKAFDFESVNGALCHLIPLRKKGYVTWQDGQARTLRVTEDTTNG